LKELGRITPEKLADFKKEFQKLADYIIVDSAAGLGHEAVSVIKLADELIIVTNPEMPAITDALKTIKFAEQIKKPVRGVIMTRVRKDKIEIQPDSVKEILETPILGMIPEEVSVRESINLKDAVVHTHPSSKSARAYKEIAAQILEIEYDSDKDKLGFWRRIFLRRF
ncbi:P-loop NTPase, partial [Candidatus Pacearchaeota archaeon]|nr:P-loop NTPase [Candidatus Pacearchaeota archaeon]